MGKASKATLLTHELAEIEVKGKLKPEDVVKFARTHPQSQLHKEFLWDDGEAAELYRLEQARRIIKVIVVIRPSGNPSQTIVVPKWQAPPLDDRGTGYRPVDVVMEKAASRTDLLEQTIRRLASIKEVGLFKELQVVDAEIKRLVKKYLP